MKRGVAGLLWAATCAAVFVVGAPARSQSLYDPASFRPLTADNRAARVGDAITIQVIESAVASANADTGTGRRNNLGVDLAVSHPRSRSATASVGMNGEFDGGGQTQRAGRLVAQLTVTVKEVLPNGDLLVAGEQTLTINDERQRIGISGRVRPQDVSDTNVVVSSRVADADITYIGEGHLADRQKPAWWRQLVDWLGF